ncbi:MAG: NAD-dependent epimerase [Bacteroidales bacterium]|nr:NAD-dependent epimerase [Bacteroidales bacterium]
MKKILVTGTAGFIGFHLSSLLLEQGHEVVGLDSINDYYEIGLKYSRLENNGIQKEDISYGKLVSSTTKPGHKFIQLQLEDKEKVLQLFKDEKFDIVINLAAQAGVRYSLTNPEVYINSNITGFLNILEACRFNPVENLIYASSSSVYGLNTSMPFSVRSNVDHPVSLYAASKKSNELMAHTYSHLFGIPTIGLRFFTVYGPWGRPDMALFLFTKAILEGKPIEVFNEGKMQRDFTYVDDIVAGISRMVDKPHQGNNEWNSAQPDPSSSSAPYRIYNIGNNNPVKLMDFVNAIESALGIEADKIMKPIQAGDVEKTWADVNALIEDYDYKPNTSIEKGIREFISWYRNYYNK